LAEVKIEKDNTLSIDIFANNSLSTVYIIVSKPRLYTTRDDMIHLSINDNRCPYHDKYTVFRKKTPTYIFLHNS